MNIGEKVYRDIKEGIGSAKVYNGGYSISIKKENYTYQGKVTSNCLDSLSVIQTGLLPLLLGEPESLTKEHLGDYYRRIEDLLIVKSRNWLAKKRSTGEDNQKKTLEKILRINQ